MLSLKLIDKATPYEVKLLVKWRKQVQSLWGETFKVTYKGTKKWINNITKNKTKAFFLIIKNNEEIGQIGYQEVGENYCEIGYVIRGEGKSDGSMSEAMRFLIKLAFGKRIYLSVLKSNTHAIRFYKRLGFSILSEKGNSFKMQYGKNKNNH